MLTTFDSHLHRWVCSHAVAWSITTSYKCSACSACLNSIFNPFHLQYNSNHSNFKDQYVTPNTRVLPRRRNSSVPRWTLHLNFNKAGWNFHHLHEPGDSIVLNVRSKKLINLQENYTLWTSAVTNIKNLHPFKIGK